MCGIKASLLTISIFDILIYILQIITIVDYTIRYPSIYITAILYTYVAVIICYAIVDAYCIFAISTNKPILDRLAFYQMITITIYIITIACLGTTLILQHNNLNLPSSMILFIYGIISIVSCMISIMLRIISIIFMNLSVYLTTLTQHSEVDTYVEYVDNYPVEITHYKDQR
jgi:hypothetical protein